MTRTQSDIALNVAQKCLSHRRSVLHVAKVNNIFFMSSFFVIKSQNLGLDYFNDIFLPQGLLILDRHAIYLTNYVIVALVVIQSP
jgi:hypothetical protein